MTPARPGDGGGGSSAWRQAREWRPSSGRTCHWVGATPRPLARPLQPTLFHSDLWAAGQAGGGPGPPGATTPHGISEQRRSPAAGGTVRNSGKASAGCHGGGKQEQTEGRRPASGLSQEHEQRPGRGRTWRPSGRAGSAGAWRGGRSPGQRLREGTGPLYRGISGMTQMNPSVSQKQDPGPREQPRGCQGGGVAGKLGGG